MCLEEVLLIWLGWIETCWGFRLFIITDVYIDNGWISLKHIAVLVVDLLHILTKTSTNTRVVNHGEILLICLIFQDTKIVNLCKCCAGFS
jgi:hypothetical protein